jgi:two-component system, LytTR family, sensor kinase
LKVMKARKIYWVAQFAGWLAYGALLLIAVASEKGVTNETVVSVISWIILGIGITHLQRFIFLRLGWLEMKLPQLIPWLLLSSSLSALLINACLLVIDFIMN